MPSFRVRFSDNRGTIREEVGEYTTKVEAIQSYYSRGLIPLSVKRDFNFDPNNIVITKTIPKDKLADVLEFLADSISTGVPILETLEDLLFQNKTGYINIMLKGMDAGVRKGDSLSDVMAKYPTVFNESAVYLVKVGESTGKTADILQELAETTRRSGDLVKSLVGSLVYPVVILLFALIVIYMLIVYMVPTVTAMYSQVDGNLPEITVFVVSASEFIREKYILVIAGILLLVALTIFLFVNSKTRFYIDYLMVRTPMIGNFIRTYEMFNISYVLASLFEGGVSTERSLDIVSRVVKNRFIAKEILEVKKDVVSNGTSLSASFGKTKHVLPEFIHNVTSGERSGQLPRKLFKLAERLEKNVNKSLERMKKVISPTLIAILAVFVGILIFAVMSPIYSIMDYV